MAKRAGYEDGAGSGGGKQLPPAGVGHNASVETFLKSVKKSVAHAAERKALNERINSERKQMKADGVELGLMDATIKLMQRDRGEVRAHFDLMNQYARWANVPIGTQANLFEGQDDDEAQARECWEMGKTAGLAGFRRVYPDNVDAKFGPFWDRGYDGKEFVWEKPAPAAAKPPKGGKGLKAVEEGGKTKVAPATKKKVDPPAKTKEEPNDGMGGQPGDDDGFPTDDAVDAANAGAVH